MSPLGSPRIGLFDSGIGGFTVLRHVLEACPGIPCTYIGDLKHVPYGDRSLEEIRQIAGDLITFLEAEGCTHIVVACNTSTAALRDFPLDSPIPILNVIDPLEQWLADRAGIRRVGVVANPVTARRRIHAQVLEIARPIEVVTVGAPTLVDLLETCAPLDELDAAVREATADLLAAGVDAVVYGCTHYPLAASSFRASLGPEATLVDTGALVAQQLGQLLDTPGNARSHVDFITTAPSDDFGRWIARVFPDDLEWTLRTHDPFEIPQPVCP